MKYIMIFAFALLLSCKKEKLEQERVTAAKEVCDTDFNVFFIKFGKDSIFQKKHVKFPLKNSFLDENYENMVREDISYTKYSFIDFSQHSKAMEQETDKFTIEVKKAKDSVNYLMRGYDNGIYVDIKFAFTNGCWQMVEIDDSST